VGPDAISFLTPTIGRCYSSGSFGHAWSVRRILALDPALDTVTCKIVAGPGRRRTETMTRAEFERWARYEVVQEESEWVRVG